MDTAKFQCPAEKGSSRKLGFRYTGFSESPGNEKSRG